MTDDLCKAGIMIEEMAKKASEGDCGEKDGRPIMEHVVEANMPTKYGDFKIHGYVNRLNGEHHVALTMGDFSDGESSFRMSDGRCIRFRQM